MIVVHALAVLAYHADDEIARVERPGRIVGYVVAAAVGAWLARRPTRARGANWPARAALAVGGGAVAVWLVTKVVDLDRAPSFGADAASIALAVATFVSPVLAAIGVGRGREAPLAGAAAGISLVLPANVVAAIVACGVTDACFH